MLHVDLFGRRRVPFVAASELNECGLACLAAICEFHRGDFNLNDIRRLAVPSGRGETLLDVRNIAESIGLSARGVRLNVKGLAKLALPAILHWDMYHFVVLEKVMRDGVVIMDPAAGRMSLPWRDVEASFTGVALEVQPSDRWIVARRAPKKVGPLEFVRPISRWRREIAVILALSVLLEAMILIVPMQMQLSVDNAVQASDGRLVWVLGASFGLLMLLLGSVATVRAWSFSVFGTKVGFDLRNRFVRALHEKPPTFFLKHHTGDILNRARSVDTIQSLITAQLLQALMDALMSVAMVTVMIIAVPLLGMLALVFALFNVGVTSALRQAAIQNSRRHLRAVAKADEIFLENARAGRAIRLFGREQVRIGVWRARFVDVTNLALANARLLMFSSQAAQTTGLLSNVVLIAAGTYLVIEGTITLGTMMMIAVFQALFVARLNSFVTYLMELRYVQTHAERIDEVLSDASSAPADPNSKAPYQPGEGEPIRLEMKDVWFRYGNDAPWILKGASLCVEPGDSVAITGRSGSGKTTLMALMIGLLQPTRGEVLINGRNLHTVSSHDLARLIGVVMQDDILFQGTVADNIAFFNAPVDMGRVREAATQANIAKEIEAMPMGYYSILAEAAADVSGGQRQRLFIARAIHHKPRILVLDEATSHLDSHSERLVSDAIRSMKITKVLVAHRKETIATADRVLELDTESGQLRQVAAAGILTSP